MDKTDAVLKLSRQIFEIEVQEGKLREKLKSLMQDLRMLTEGGGNGAQAQGSMPARVLSFIVDHPHGDYDAREVTEGIGESPDKITLVRGTLSRLHEGDKIDRKKRGRYRAVREVRIGAKES